MAKINYNFKTSSDTDFILALTTEVNNRTLELLFIQAKNRLIPSASVDQLSKIDKFEIDNRYYGFIKTTLKSQLDTIFREVKKDGIKVHNSAVQRAYFLRQSTKDTWQICIEVTGVYTDDRAIRGASG